MKSLHRLFPLQRLFLLVLFIMTQTAIAQNHKTFQWIGGPTYVLHLGSFKILTDPMLSPKSDSAFMIKQHPSTGEMNAWIKRLIAPADFDLTNIDLLLISHPHADHFDKEAKERLDKKIHLIAPAINKETIRGWGFTDITGLNWGDTTVLNKDDEKLTIIAVEAVHAAQEPLRTQLGKGNGYIIEYRRHNKVYRIYWTGDTVWFDEINSFAQYGKIDLLVPDMSAVGSDGKIGRRGLNAADCLHIANTLHPASIIPVHHSTFSMYVEPISVLRDTLDRSPFKRRLHILQTGETIAL